jgi:hypothetical protein
VSLGGNAFQVDIASPVTPSTIVWDDGLGTSSSPEAYNGASGDVTVVILQDDLIGG